MRIRVNLYLPAIIILCLFYASVTALAQDSISCKVVKKYNDGSYLVQIGEKTFLAVTEEIQKNALKKKRDLLDAQKEIILKDSLLAKYEQNLAWYEATNNHMKKYILELEDTYKGYKNLYRDYKKLKEPWVSLEGGIGATGDTKPAILAGIQIRQIHVWGFLQEKNSGALIGANFRLF